MNLRYTRPGTTFIELLIFIAIIGIVASVVLPLLFSATEDRVLQQTISVVEQNGSQLMQEVGRQVRAAERILSPALQQTGSVLTLQSGSGSLNPVIIGVNSGALVIVQHTTRSTLSSQQVAITGFRVRNTSTSASKPSVLVQFRVTRTIRLQAPRKYSRVFEGVFTLFPDDTVTGDDCGCTVSGCAAGSNYLWQVCENSSCWDAETPMECS